MTLIRRFFGALLGLFMLSVTVYFCFLAQEDSRFIVWFGISAAILAPLGLTLLGYAFPRQDTLAKRLAKVPDIHTLIEQAETHEESVRRLAEERARLEDIVRVESRRQALMDRIDSLKGDASRILGEMDELDSEMSDLNQEVGKGAASEEIRHLRERVKARRRGDAILRVGARQYRIDHRIIAAIPLGDLLLELLNFAEQLVRRTKISHINKANEKTKR